MESRSFKQAFNAVFHDENAFEDFRNLDIDSEIERFTINARAINKTSGKLKKYLRFIDKVILRNLRKNERAVHSYTKGRSSLTAVQEHVKSKYFFTTDVQEFFVNIAADDVRKILARDADLIPISDFFEYIPTIVKYTAWGDSIPVGFATSPSLSNAFLFEFDSALSDLCIERGLIYSRYSDDIIISGRLLHKLSDLEEKIQRALREHASERLVIDTRKTKITHLGNKVKILGLIITPDRRITIDKKYKNTLESLLHFFVSDKKKYIDLLERKFNGKEHSLFGLLHYARSIDPRYLERLQRKYGAYALSSLMDDKRSD